MVVKILAPSDEELKDSIVTGRNKINPLEIRKILDYLKTNDHIIKSGNFTNIIFKKHVLEYVVSNIIGQDFNSEKYKNLLNIECDFYECNFSINDLDDIINSIKPINTLKELVASISNHDSIRHDRNDLGYAVEIDIPLSRYWGICEYDEYDELHVNDWLYLTKILKKNTIMEMLHQFHLGFLLFQCP